MPIVKIWKQGEKIIVDNGLLMKDITNDKRTKLLNIDSMKEKEFGVDACVYILNCPTFTNMAQKLNKQHISLFIIRDECDIILIVNPKDYIFYDGRSVDPEEYNLLKNVKFNADLFNQIKNGPVEDG
jgi:hypothetical protein